MSAGAGFTVGVRKAAGHTLITEAEFIRLPYAEQVDLVLSGRAQFIRGGQMVEARSALRAIRRARWAG